MLEYSELKKLLFIVFCLILRPRFFYNYAVIFF